MQIVAIVRKMPPNFALILNRWHKISNSTLRLSDPFLLQTAPNKLFTPKEASFAEKYQCMGGKSHVQDQLGYPISARRHPQITMKCPKRGRVSK